MEIKFISWNYYRGMNYNPIVSDGTDGGETSRVDLNSAILDCEDVLMQYIGRKDINGKDIYSDFIVKCDLGIKYKVIFSNEWCAFMLIENKTDRQIVIYPEMKLEVIGNIYENPELLNGNNA